MALTPGLYRHFKGGLYDLLGVATHTETGEELAVYRSIETGRLFVRPAAMFEGSLERAGYSGPRFTRILEEG